MHEWALADGVISTAIKVAKKEGIKEITKIKVKMGELQQIDVETFKFALKEIIRPQSALLKNVDFNIEPEKAVLKCRVCGYEWSFTDTMKRLDSERLESIHFLPEIAHVYVRCPKCKSPDFEVLNGRGVWIEYIEGE